MKLAVNYNPDNEEIFFHFGQTEYFKIYTIEDKAITGSELADVRDCPHGTLPEYLHGQQVNTVICGGLGRPMAMKINGFGMELICGVSGKADEAVRAYLAGQLSSNTDAVHECHHHG